MTHSYKFVFSGTKIVILDLKYKVMEVDVLNKKVTLLDKSSHLMISIKLTGMFEAYREI